MYTIGQLAKRFKLSRSTLLYYDAIGSYPSNFICRAIVEDIEKETYSMAELEYALQETAFAPRPAWAYTAAILKRIQEDKKRGDGFPF